LGTSPHPNYPLFDWVNSSWCRKKKTGKSVSYISGKRIIKKITLY